MLPTTTLPKLYDDGFALMEPCVPVPLRGIDAGEPAALLVMEMLPDALPAEVGANCAVIFALPPALIVAGSVRPDMLKPVPVALAAVIVSAPLPGFESIIVCEELLPTLTLPKETLVGLIVSCG